MKERLAYVAFDAKEEQRLAVGSHMDAPLCLG